MHRTLQVAALVVGLLALTAPSQALFVETPLRLTADKGEADPGQKVNFTVDAANDTAQAQYQGKSVRVTWENLEGDEGSPKGGEVLASLLLDAKAHATFDWTLPEATRDKNVFVVLWDGSDRLGQAHIRVGNAPPMAFITGGGPGTVEEEPAPPAPQGNTQGNGTRDTGGAAARTPGAGVLLLVAGLGAVAVLAARRKA